MDTTRAVEMLRQRRESLKQGLSAVGDMRPGSLVSRYRQCGKPNCHCATPGHPGHGPSWSVSKAVGGKTVTRVIAAGPAVERTRQQLTEYRRFRKLSRELVDVSERLCETQLEEAKVTSEKAAEKGGFKRRSNGKSRVKSRR